MARQATLSDVETHKKSGLHPEGRFNRARYDADRIVAALASRLKDEVDLDSIRDDLAGAVQRALEPAHASVWINEKTHELQLPYQGRDGIINQPH